MSRGDGKYPTIATLSTFGGSWKRARWPNTRPRAGGGKRGWGGCSMVGVRRPYPRNIRTTLRKIGSRARDGGVRVIGEAEGWSRRRNSVALPYRASNWIKPISRMGNGDERRVEPAGADLNNWNKLRFGTPLPFGKKECLAPVPFRPRTFLIPTRTNRLSRPLSRSRNFLVIASGSIC